MSDSEKKTAAVYVSWGTFKNAIDQLSQGLPNRLDRTVFTGMAWAIQNQLFSGMRFLGLIDSANRPTAELDELVGIEEELRKERLKGILQRRYSDLFALDLKKTTPGELAQKMGESYGVAGDTREKAVRFFTSATEYIGIELSPLFEIGKKTNGGTPGPKKGKRGKLVRVNLPQEPALPATPTGTSKTVKLGSGGTLVLSASLDLFSLNPDDRKFLFALIDQLEEYERKPNPATDSAPSVGV
jgi:hypothetical protein